MDFVNKAFIIRNLVQDGNDVQFIMKMITEPNTEWLRGSCSKFNENRFNLEQLYA